MGIKVEVAPAISRKSPAGFQGTAGRVQVFSNSKDKEPIQEAIIMRLNSRATQWGLPCGVVAIFGFSHVSASDDAEKGFIPLENSPMSGQHDWKMLTRRTAEQASRALACSQDQQRTGKDVTVDSIYPDLETGGQI